MSAVKRAQIKQGKRLQAQAKSLRDSGIGAKAQVQIQAKSARDSGIGAKAQVAMAGETTRFVFDEPLSR